MNAHSRVQPDAFHNHRDAALALLNQGGRTTRKGGSFLGQLAVDPTPMSPAQADWLEAAIDTLNETLAPLTSFILPGGSEGAARVHVARTIARRAERAGVALAALEPINPAALTYLNRLSDYLFVLARALNAGNDPLWVPGASR